MPGGGIPPLRLAGLSCAALEEAGVEPQISSGAGAAFLLVPIAPGGPAEPGGAKTPLPKREEDVLLFPAAAEAEEVSSSSIISSRRAPLPSTARGGDIDLRLAEEDPAKSPSSSPIPSSLAAEEKLNPSLPPMLVEKLVLPAPVPRGRPIGWKLDPDETRRECEGTEMPAVEEEEAEGCPWPS